MKLILNMQLNEVRFEITINIHVRWDQGYAHYAVASHDNFCLHPLQAAPFKT